MNHEWLCNPVPAADIPGFNFDPAVSGSCETIPSAVYPVFIDLWL